MRVSADHWKEYLERRIDAEKCDRCEAGGVLEEGRVGGTELKSVGPKARGAIEEKQGASHQVWETAYDGVCSLVSAEIVGFEGCG